MSANIPQEFNNFFLKDVSFVNLMTRRIFNVLIVAGHRSHHELGE